MITVSEARQIIAQKIQSPRATTLPLSEAAGMTLARDIRSTCDVPDFPQSAMDGYAYHFDSWQKQGELRLSGEVAAGDQPETPLLPGQAVRIFTGAPLPPGADTVVQQEHTSVTEGLLRIDQPDQEKGKHVRARGSEIRSGEIALREGQSLTPAAIGFLMSVGITDVQVYAPPRVGIIVTGKELQDPGKPLAYGQVYESNSGTLSAALRQAGVRQIRIRRADDTLESVQRSLQEELEQNDIVLLTGGISVGDYDFVLEATVQCGVDQGFYKIKQRPGKPMYFGTRADRMVFGLPGNPSSALTCFYEYVLPVIGSSTRRQLALPVQRAPLAGPYSKNNRLTQFLKGFYDGERVRLLDAQESFRLSSFARANCLVVLPEDSQECSAGQIVEIHLLPV